MKLLFSQLQSEQTQFPAPQKSTAHLGALSVLHAFHNTRSDNYVVLCGAAHTPITSQKQTCMGAARSLLRLALI